MSTSTTVYRRAKQGRSRRTLERILDATEELLGDRSFDSIRVADVLERAQVSTGSFYARFPGKEALLAALYERHQLQAIAAADSVDEDALLRDGSVSDIVREFVRRVAGLYRQRRGLYRTLVLRGFARPDARYADPDEVDRLVVARVAGLIAGRRTEIVHPNPEAAARLGCVAALATLRETLLFGDSTAAAVAFDDAQLEEELVLLILAYLGVER